MDHQINPLLFLWTGPKHSGKSTNAAKLIEQLILRGRQVGGILAPARYQGRKLTGYDIIDVRTGGRARLAELISPLPLARHFEFIASGVKYGKDALDPENLDHCDLVVIDEYGPFEIEGHGWRKQTDCLVKLKAYPLMLVVRQELIKTVQELYHVPDNNILNADDERNLTISKITG